jgi:uncharacterized protein
LWLSVSSTCWPSAVCFCAAFAKRGCFADVLGWNRPGFGLFEPVFVDDLAPLRVGQRDGSLCGGGVPRCGHGRVSVDAVFTTTNLVLGVVAALIIGLSKTAVPGGGLLATPLLASVVSGRLIAGLTIPVLLLADVFAIAWFGRNARRDVLRPMVVPVSLGFVFGTLFYVIVKDGGRILDVVIGGTVLALVLLQLWRLARKSPPVVATPPLVNAVGVSGGFATFVSNAAGPIMNTYFTGIGLPKDQIIGTSAWFYLAVNAAKLPVYLAIGKWSSGGPFFTAESLRFDLAIAPAVIVGVFAGRWMLPRISQQVFTLIVLILAALASVKLLAGW